MKIRFPERGRSGRSVVAINNLEFGFEDKVSYFTGKLMFEILSSLFHLDLLDILLIIIACFCTRCFLIRQIL
jgi:hypothetical protein